MDSRWKSISESGVNLIPGFIISYVSNKLILPHYAPGIADSSDWVMIQIGVWYTVISIVRSYLLRRGFERLGERENLYTLLLKGIRRLRRRP